MHGKGLWIVVFLHQAPAVLQNDVHRLDKLVRRQAAVRFPEGHAASGGVKTDAKQVRCLELTVDEMLGSDLRENIVVIHGGCTAAAQQFTKPGQAAVKDAVLIQPFPDLIQGNEPREQLHLLHLRQISREGLIKVIVRVD